MSHPSHHRAVLGPLYIQALARAFFRHKNPRRRRSAQHMDHFHERVWREAATRLGASFEPVGAGVSEVRLGPARTRVFEHVTAIDDPVTHRLAADKPLTYRLLARQGLPTPRHAGFSFRSMGAARDFLDASARDCVVKPAAGTGGGRGVTTGIRTPWQLARAAASAAVYGDDLLIEEQAEGDNYRLLYLDGQLLDAFSRKPPTAVADGRSNVARLVRLANDARAAFGPGLSQVLLTVDLDMKRTLARQGLSLRSVPAEGRVVTLKTVVNENCGVDNATATHRLADEVVAAGAKAAHALGVRLAGVDLITTDPTIPLAQSGGVIIEVNTPPNLYFHYHKRDGAFPAAVPILEALLFQPSPAPEFHPQPAGARPS